jgi:hypothetical protein
MKIKYGNYTYKISTYKDIGSGLAEVTFVRKLAKRTIMEKTIVREAEIMLERKATPP